MSRVTKGIGSQGTTCGKWPLSNERRFRQLRLGASYILMAAIQDGCTLCEMVQINWIVLTRGRSDVTFYDGSRRVDGRIKPRPPKPAQSRWYNFRLYCKA